MELQAFPNTVTSATGGKFATWSGLQNVKSSTTNYAITALINGKNSTPNRPGTITATNFKLNLPTGAKVNSITVDYIHSLQAYNGKYISMTAPTITLTGVGDGYSKYGVTPTSNSSGTKRSVVFKPNNPNDFSITNLNNSNFGVILNYPYNNSSNSGYVQLRVIRITVDYTETTYNIGYESPSTIENGEIFDTTLVVTNTNLTDYQTTLTILTPPGFSLRNTPTGDGTWTKIENRQYTWKPNFTSTKASINLGLSFNVNVTGALPYNATFTAIEPLTEQTTTKTISVTEPTGDTGTTTDDEPYTPGITDDSSDPSTILPTIRIPKRYPSFVKIETPSLTQLFGIEATFALEILKPAYHDDYLAWTEEDGKYESGDIKGTLTANTPTDLATQDYSYFNDGFFYLFFGANSYTKGTVTLTFYDDYDDTSYTNSFNVEVIPWSSDLTTPSSVILFLDDEELDRLGDGYSYTLQSFLKETTSETYVRDWYKNFRLGVFNNPISDNITNYTYTDEYGETQDLTYDSTNYDSLTTKDLIDNAEYWSQPPQTVNTYEDLSVQFPYNKEYPLYIIVTGDYSEASTPASISFTNPCLVESVVFHSREASGNYPIPIKNVLTTEDSTINLPVYENSTPVIVYNLDVSDDYGTNTEMAVRGIAVTLTIEDYSECVLSAQLRSPTGATGERSVNIEAEALDENNTITIGGMGDLWNFNTLDLIDLKDWEVQLTLHNLLTETETIVSYDNVQIVFYVEQIETQQDFAYINGEDIRYYGAFVKDIDIPAGLKTSTSYLSVDGTDTNDAYRQNIREKDITLQLEVGDNCDLKTATDNLRQLTQLILNERDKYNRPIPKQIRFSFMPDVYFEYIVEDTFDNPIEISSYDIKVKLTVPSGTAYKTKSTTTNTTGYVQGLAKVNPILSIKPTGSNIEVTETTTNQKFTITYNGDTTGKIIIIDCENRRCHLQNDEDSTDYTDITKYVDFNSDWFYLQKNYNFTSTNAYIRSVNYTERW